MNEDVEASQLDIIAVVDVVDENDRRLRIEEETTALLLAIAYSIIKIVIAAAMEFWKEAWALLRLRTGGTVW